MRTLARITVVAVLALFASGTPARGAGWAPPSATPAPAAAPLPPPPLAPAPPPAAPEPPATIVPAPPLRVGAPELLRAADAAVAVGDLASARILLDRLLREAPTAPEAAEARRALNIMALTARAYAPASPAGRTPPPGTPAGATATDPSDSVAIVIREEPYSTKTSERLRLTSWEKLDFGVTAFLYGMSLGFSYSLGLDSSSSTGEFTMPIALGAMTYALGAVGYLSAANPDRGDLPLMLAITSYVPTTTLLIGHFAYDNPSDKKVAVATVAAGLASIPLAVALTKKLNLDPGDTQLVRDAGFWGLLLSTAGTMGFGGDTVSYPGFSYRQDPSDRKVSGFGLLGLFGGLGLGALAAANTEISLERVRVTTWGGYGGAVVGGLVGTALYAHEEDVGLFRGITIGAFTGLLVTFVTTAALDGIPPKEASSSPPSALRWTPTLAPLTGANGVPVPSVGFAGVL